LIESKDSKGCQALEQAAQGSGWVTIPGGISKTRRCGTGTRFRGGLSSARL